jgi:20S proteasome subunit beta 2
MGSGSLAAMSVFESEYQDDLTKEQAMEMVCNAIEAGIFNDLGSGSNVDLLVIEKVRERQVLCMQRSSQVLACF